MCLSSHQGSLLAHGSGRHSAATRVCKELGGAASPPPHLCVDADGSDGRDLKIVTCKGRRGGLVWHSETHIAGGTAS